MLNFKDFYALQLQEAVKSADTLKVAKLIQSYLSKKVKGGVVLYPSMETIKHGSEVYTCLQYIANQKLIVRFNWLHGKCDQNALHSVTIFTGEDSKFEVSFDKDVSLVQTLPQIVTILNKPIATGSFEIQMDESFEDADVESILISESTEVNALDYIRSAVSKMSVGDKVSPGDFDRGHSRYAYKLFHQLMSNNPKAFAGKTLNSKNLDWSEVEATFARSRVGGKITKDATKETYVQDPALNDMDDELEEQITYIEKVNDLSSMVKFMIKGATNAIFVAGRGGTGKTQTVEDTLAEEGKTDGNGYFKVTTSASPAGMYETLYRNKDGIVLFDDCDGALDSQDGRNLIKAATDTKHVRKVSWNKKGGNYYDPDTQEEPEEGEEGNDLPRYFNYTGKIIFISNLDLKKLDPDGALRTRAMMIELNPTNMEIYEFMGLIYNKIALEPGKTLSEDARKQVYEELKEIVAKKKENTVNLRLLVRSLNLAATGLGGWQRMLRYS